MTMAVCHSVKHQVSFLDNPSLLLLLQINGHFSDPVRLLMHLTSQRKGGASFLGILRNNPKHLCRLSRGGGSPLLASWQHFSECTQDPIDLLGHKGRLLAHPQHTVPPGLPGLSLQSCSPAGPCPASSFHPAEVPLNGSTALWGISHSSQLCVINKVAEGAHHPLH